MNLGNNLFLTRTILTDEINLSIFFYFSIEKARLNRNIDQYLFEQYVIVSKISTALFNSSILYKFLKISSSLIYLQSYISTGKSKVSTNRTHVMSRANHSHNFSKRSTLQDFFTNFRIFFQSFLVWNSQLNGNTKTYPNIFSRESSYRKRIIPNIQQSEWTYWSHKNSRIFLRLF